MKPGLIVGVRWEKVRWCCSRKRQQWKHSWRNEDNSSQSESIEFCGSQDDFLPQHGQRLFWSFSPFAHIHPVSKYGVRIKVSFLSAFISSSKHPIKARLTVLVGQGPHGDGTIFRNPVPHGPVQAGKPNEDLLFSQKKKSMNPFLLSVENKARRNSHM